MKDTDPMSRRSVLKITGVAGITTAIAGCGGGPGNGNGENGSEEPAGEDPAEEEDPAAGEEEPGAEEEGNETEDGNETDEESAGGGEAIEPDTQIVLEAQTSGWVGVEPEQIADEDNPTITLQQDESYEIGWEEGDGSQHNIELVDDSDEVVEDYQTDESSEGGEDQFIEFDATDEITEYVCRPHETTMRGTIELEEGGGGNGGAMEENGNESDDEMGNETEGNETDEEMGNETEDNESDA